jgi:hypothetical protein
VCCVLFGECADLCRSNAIPAAAVGEYETDAQFTTADLPGSSDEAAMGTPLRQSSDAALSAAQTGVVPCASTAPQCQNRCGLS